MLVNYTDIWTAFLQTLTMVGLSLLFSTLIGLPLGILLVVTRKGALLEQIPFFNVLSSIVNIFRSVPFIILLVAIIPLTRLIVGSSIGTQAAIVPLVFYAAPYIARLIESSLLEVDTGVLGGSGSDGGDTVADDFPFSVAGSAQLACSEPDDCDDRFDRRISNGRGDRWRRTR